MLHQPKPGPAGYNGDPGTPGIKIIYTYIYIYIFMVTVTACQHKGQKTWSRAGIG